MRRLEMSTLMGNGSMMSLPTNGMSTPSFVSHALFPTYDSLWKCGFLRLKKADKAEIERRALWSLENGPVSWIWKRSIQKLIRWSTLLVWRSGYYHEPRVVPLYWAPVCTFWLRNCDRDAVWVANCKQRFGDYLLSFVHPMTKKKFLPWVTGSLSWMKGEMSTQHTGWYPWWTD